jgi:hypothetical protein
MTSRQLLWILALSTIGVRSAGQPAKQDDLPARPKCHDSGAVHECILWVSGTGLVCCLFVYSASQIAKASGRAGGAGWLFSRGACSCSFELATLSHNRVVVLVFGITSTKVPALAGAVTLQPRIVDRFVTGSNPRHTNVQRWTIVVNRVTMLLPCFARLAMPKYSISICSICCFDNAQRLGCAAE